ncbi:chemotaxis protein CheX [bacterium]|nr:chemotaxis protein CheX [bacterium]
MTEKFREALIDVFCQVLEQIAFAFGEETPKEELPSDELANYLHCEVGFRGPCKGTIAITLPFEFCKELAANALGIEQDEMAPGMAEDSLKEIGNVTCGQWITAVAGKKAVFDLTVPEVKALNEAAWVELRDSSSSIAMLVDDVPALIGVSVTGDMPE